MRHALRFRSSRARLPAKRSPAGSGSGLPSTLFLRHALSATLRA